MRKESQGIKGAIGFLVLSMLALGAIIFSKRWLPQERVELPELYVMVATDLHFISPELTDHGSYFTAMVEQADGKTMMYSEEVVDAFVLTVLQKQPDVLVLTGDLTFNGAKKSHEDLVKKLEIIETAGIPVLVLSGNHDVNSRNAASFQGESYELVESVTEEEFETLYASFGLEEALSVDTASSSYVWKNAAGYRFLMLDVNGVETPNSVPEETLQWLEQELQKAQEEGDQVIAFSHQNLLRHSFFTTGYIINNAGEVLRLYQKFGVLANFSGHLHIQHIEEKDGFYEMATSALSVAPTQYGEIRCGGSTLEYQTSSVDVSDWAKKQGLTTGTLTVFDEYAKRFFVKTCDWQAYSELYYRMDDVELMQKMIAYYSEQNYAYFSGRLDLVEQNEEVLNEWKKLGNFVSVYLETIAQEERVNQNQLMIEME